MTNSDRWRLRLPWIVFACFGLPEAASVAFVHTFGDPRNAGIGNVHSEFVLMLLGGLSAVGLALWLVPAGIYSCFHWRELGWIDFGMLFLSACTAAIVLYPGWFF